MTIPYVTHHYLVLVLQSHQYIGAANTKKDFGKVIIVVACLHFHD
jgi:hypothetical protein